MPLLDEPVASLDPLARREFLRMLMEDVAEYGTSVVLSSHLVADLERVCDYLVVLVASMVRVAGETGTFRLAWTQSISRTRWVAVKLGLTGLAGLAAMATAGLLSLLFTWWASPIDRVLDTPYTLGTFGSRGLVPVGYAAFAFALGVTVGLLVRRSVPAIAVTLAVFTAVQFAVPLWVRPRLFAPVRTVLTLNAGDITTVGAGPHGNNMFASVNVNIPGAWVYSSQVTTAGGSTDLGRQPPQCFSGSWNTCVAALEKLNLREVVTYQPASRYWAFQWTETGIYLVAALLLTGFCVWRVSRRLSR